MNKNIINAYLLWLLVVTSAENSTAHGQMFNGLFSDISVNMARQAGFIFDGPGINLKHAPSTFGGHHDLLDGPSNSFMNDGGPIQAISLDQGLGLHSTISARETDEGNIRMYTDYSRLSHDDDEPEPETLQLEDSKFQKWEPISDTSDDASIRYASILQPQGNVQVGVNFGQTAADRYTPADFTVYNDNQSTCNL